MGLNNASPNAPQEGVLRWRYIEDDVYKVRDLDVYLSRGLGFQPLESWRSWAVQEGLEFIAPNPVIYDPAVKTGTVSSFAATLTFSMYFPFVLGAMYGTANITYAGTWETHPTIIITGPAAGVYVENRSTGNFLRFNYVISAGEVVTITTAYNNRTITNGAGQNLLPYLSDDSTFGEFTLQPDPIITGGVNTIDVYTDGAVAGTTTIVLSYLNRYYGI